MSHDDTDITSANLGAYTLIGQTPVPCADTLAWARWHKTNLQACIVKQQTVLGLCWVSTVFLGLDHAFGRFMGSGARPVLFETMAFWRGEGGEEMSRCCTWLEAEEAHRRMVAEVARPRAVLSYLGRMLCGTVERARRDWVRRWRELCGRKREPGGDADLDRLGDLSEKMEARLYQEDGWF